MPVDEARAELRTLRGIGEFFATAILMRGAGLVDAYPDDRMTRAGIGRFYGIDEPTDSDVTRITEGWRPYRMWCSCWSTLGAAQPVIRRPVLSRSRTWAGEP